MSAIKLIVLVTCYLTLAASQQAEQFEPSQYLGNWFEIYRTSNMPFEKGSNIVANYGPKSSNSITVTNYEYLSNENRWQSIQGDAIVEDLNMPAKLGVKFYVLQPRANYIVLYTDYTDVSVVYSYEDLFFGAYTIQYGWILSRNKTLPQSVIDQAFNIFQTQVGLSQDKFQQTPQQEGIIPPQLATTQ